MSWVDSAASFKTRCVAVGGNDDLWNSLRRRNIGTFSDFSFACGTPQSPPSDETFRLFAEDVVGASITLGQTSKLRCLHLEAATIIVARLRQQVTGDSAEAPKKLPLAEKEARFLSSLDCQGSSLKTNYCFPMSSWIASRRMQPLVLDSSFQMLKNSGSGLRLRTRC